MLYNRSNTERDAMHQIVFLDRDSLAANVRPPRFAHAWTDYPATDAADVVTRLAGASIAITNKVPLRAEAIAQLPSPKLVAVAATGTHHGGLGACRPPATAVA